MTAFVTAPAGFLLAVLWFDLMFDVQVRGRKPVPEPALASIAAYYSRVTTKARPMNLLIAAMMLVTLSALVVQLVNDEASRWVSIASLGLAGSAIGIAAGRTVSAAQRLGRRSDSMEEQGRMARSICRDHLVCFGAIATTIALQLIFAT